jgi:hypothetical protein
MDEIVKFKLNIANVLNTIKMWNTPGVYDSCSEFDGFNNVITAAYGMIDNPYDKILESILRMKRRLEKVSERISEYWILENLNFIGKPQTFNNDLVLEHTRNTDNNHNINEWYKIIDDFDDAIVRYNDALSKRDTVILKKYLKFTNTRNKIGKFWFKYEVGKCFRIEYKDGMLQHKKYHFGDNWFIYTSTETSEFSKEDKENERIWKAEAPEKYLL